MTDNIIATQGLTDLFSSVPQTNETSHLEILKNKLREFFNLKNINFLFGAGTSSGAIPTMKGLLATLSFDGERGKEEKNEFDSIKNKVGENLEEILRVLYSAKTYYSGIDDDTTEANQRRDIHQNLISKIEKHIFDSINVDFDKEESQDILKLYKNFYQKLALRNKDLARIRVFTTNNDLFNETALDSLNIHYINGFGGGLRKFINPALFNYTWSKRMDTSINKYEPVENMVYLYKIHGSINWRETKPLSNNYFEIEELASKNFVSEDSVLIYPTPTKQDKSLGTPYVDLFREFQNKLLEPHSVLFVIGYGFNDRHVNEIIYRALATNSTINVVIFGKRPKEKERINKPIFFINDNRIFNISGEIWSEDENGNRTSIRTVNHFEFIVNELLPNLDASKDGETNTLENFVQQLKQIKDQ